MAALAYGVLPPEERAATMLLLLWVTRGSPAAAGTWRADVLVRTVAVDQYRTLPFTFTVAPG